MKKIPSLITVRSQSTRLPEKCFLDFGGCSMLEHIVNRCLHFGLDPIVCTTQEKDDDKIAEIAIKTGAKIFRGPRDNKLLRWLLCCRAFGLTKIHTVDADDPFFCGDEVKRSFEMLNCGYNFVSPTISSANGGATVGYSIHRQALELVCRRLGVGDDTEMMWTLFEGVDGVAKAVLPEPKRAIITQRMTLDYWEDYIFLSAIREIVGSLASRETIWQILRKNPDLAKVNEFRNEEWAAIQSQKSKGNSISLG